MNVSALYTWVFVIASFLGGLGGALISPMRATVPGMDTEVIVDAGVPRRRVGRDHARIVAAAADDGDAFIVLRARKTSTGSEGRGGRPRARPS